MVHKSGDLAEFLGILHGDGYINHYKDGHYSIEIAGHLKKDFDYHNYHIKKLIKNLFNINPTLRLRKDQKTLYTRINSKRTFNLLKKVGMPTGKKTILLIPPWIKNKKEYFIPFIRGLFDTDGSIILRKRNQNSISLGLKNKELILEIKSLLKKLNFLFLITSTINMIKEVLNQLFTV